MFVFLLLASFKWWLPWPPVVGTGSGFSSNMYLWNSLCLQLLEQKISYVFFVSYEFRIILFSCFDAVFVARIIFFSSFFLHSLNPHKCRLWNKGINNILMIITVFIYVHTKFVCVSFVFRQTRVWKFMLAFVIAKEQTKLLQVFF